MSHCGNVLSINSAPSVVEHLIAAYGVVCDPVSKALIAAALIHEGQKIAQTVPQESFNEDRGNTGT